MFQNCELALPYQFIYIGSRGLAPVRRYDPIYSKKAVVYDIEKAKKLQRRLKFLKLFMEINTFTPCPSTSTHLVGLTISHVCLINVSAFRPFRLFALSQGQKAKNGKVT